MPWEKPTPEQSEAALKEAMARKGELRKLIAEILDVPTSSIGIFGAQLVAMNREDLSEVGFFAFPPTVANGVTLDTDALIRYAAALKHLSNVTCDRVAQLLAGANVPYNFVMIEIDKRAKNMGK